MGTRIGVLVDLLLFCNRIHQHRNEKNMEKNERQNLNRQLAQMLKGGVIMDVTTPKCQILAELGGHVVAARQGNQIATSFHPELDGDLRVHSYFLDMAK